MPDLSPCLRAIEAIGSKLSVGDRFKIIMGDDSEYWLEILSSDAIEYDYEVEGNIRLKAWRGVQHGVVGSS